MEWTVAESIKGIERSTVMIHSKVYPLTLTPEKVLHNRENEKHFKELEIKSGSSHVGVKPFFNSEILSIPLFCSMVLLFWIRP
jgi:hypothetical protein